MISRMTAVDIAVSFSLGIALAAAVGLRVFLPLLVTGMAARLGVVELGSGFAWLATWPALLMLGVATVAELLAYNIPVVDNLLDSVAMPAALIAGTVLSAAVMPELPPALRWSTAVVAGGGAAGLTQGVTTLLRAKSTAFTGGMGNPVLAAGEGTAALLVSLLALLAPIVALGLVVVLCIFALRVVARRLAAAGRERPR
jgi:hypothetical protein